MKRSTLISFIVLFALLGLADAVYLAESALTGSPLVCDIEGLSDCNVVAQSPYAHALGIPLGVYGAVFYALLLGAALWAKSNTRKEANYVVAGLATVGALSSLWFVYVQLALIKAVCIYCLASALVAFLLCIPAYLLLKKTPSPAVLPPAAVS